MKIRSTDTLSLVTSAAVATDVHVSYNETDQNRGTPKQANLNTAITTATTTVILAAAGNETGMNGRAYLTRTIETIVIRNKGASSQTVTVTHTGLNSAGSSITVELKKVTLAAGGELHYNQGNGWTTPATAPSGWNLITLTQDVANAHATPDTLADVTGLTFAVTAGDTYKFRAVIDFTSAATTTGSRWTVNGPAMTRIAFVSRWTLTATTEFFSYFAALLGGAVQASALTTGNIAVIEGFFTPSADGTFAIQFSSEVTVSAITAKAGSTLEWIKVIDA